MFEIGNSLREAREREGLDFAELEVDTRIRAKYLRALEEELFETLPAESYARGFLEVYAKRLGLDSQLYVDEFDSRFARREASEQTVGHVRTARRLRFEASAVVLGLVGIIVVTVLVIAAWQFSGGDGAVSPAVEPAPTGPVSVSEPQTSPPAPEAVPPAAAPSSDGAPAQEPQLVELQVTAIAGSRVTIRRNGPHGRVIFAGILTRGEARTFMGERLHAAFRTPADVEVTVGGEAVLPLPRRLVATADGWRRS